MSPDTKPSTDPVPFEVGSEGSGINTDQSIAGPGISDPAMQEETATLVQLDKNHGVVEPVGTAEVAGVTEGTETAEATEVVEVVPPLEVMRRNVEDKIVRLMEKGLSHPVIQKGLNDSDRPHGYVSGLLTQNANPFGFWERNAGDHLEYVLNDLGFNGGMYLGTAIDLLGEDPIGTLEELCTSQGMDLNNLAQKALSDKWDYLRKRGYTGDFGRADVAIPVGDGTYIMIPVEQRYHYDPKSGGRMQNDIMSERATFFAFKDIRNKDGIVVPLYRDVVAGVINKHYHPNNQTNKE